MRLTFESRISEIARPKSFTVFVGYLVFSGIKKEAPASNFTSPASLRYFARLLGGIALGALIGTLVFPLLMPSREAILIQLPAPWFHIVEGILGTIIVFVSALFLLLITAKSRRQ